MPITRPPRGAGKAAALIVAVCAVVVVSLFLTRNLYHAETQQELQSGHVDPAEAPKGPNDLQAPASAPR